MEVLAKLKPSRTKKEPHHEPAPSKEEIINTMDSFPMDKALVNKENNNNADPLSRKSSMDSRWESMDSDHVSTPASLSHSYSLEWEKLFTKPDMMRRLKERAMEGELRSSRFRSVVWKLFLEVLPPNMDEWIAKTRKSRSKFEELKNRLIVNPRKAVDSVDISVNNPLSQDEESPWNKFFQDNELRLTIKQDVIRTFPEVEFFRGTELRAMMIDVLFCFSREHATHSYKQGMHELLAPLIFVLHCDHQAFLHACEIESVLYCSQATRDVMKEVMDPAYLEHDAYAMFCQVMETVEPWYLSRDIFLNQKTGSMRNLELINATPFSRSQDLNPSNAIVTKLTRIQDYILKKHDPELHQHLERLEIAPQIYGIRWLRLLFGREFPMQDLLMLWDAIFGDGIGFDLVDYIFVAMLLYIKDILLCNDYATCLTVLMKFPPVADVHYFVIKAMWLREPNQQPRPPNYTHQGSIRTSTSMGSSTDSISIMNINNSGSGGGTSGKNHADNPIGSTVSLSHVEESMFRHAPSASSLARLESSTIRSAQSSPGVHHSSGFPLTPDNASVTSSPTRHATLPSKAKNKQKKLTQVERELQEKITRLQGELNDKNSMCRYCSSKLDVHINRLQQDLSKQNLDMDDEVMVSLAGLKLVRDILNGTLKFSQNLTDDDELQINDDHYGNQDVGDDNYSTGITSPESDILLGATSVSEDEMRMSERQRARLLYMSSEETNSPDSAPPHVANANIIPGRAKGGNAQELSDYHGPFKDGVIVGGECYSSAGMGGERRSSRDGEGSFGDAPVTATSNSSQFTSKIRNIFRSESSGQHIPPSTSAAAYSEAAAAARPLDDPASLFTTKGPQSGSAGEMIHKQRQYKTSHGDRELTSINSRRRAKSNVEGSNSYWPDFLSTDEEHFSNRRGHSGMPDYERRAERSGAGRRDEGWGRERSQSQPSSTTADTFHHMHGAGGEEDYGVNPLYRYKYQDSMEH